MRILVLATSLLAVPALAFAQAASTPTTGECKDSTGRPAACASGAAATDAEAVPLGAKAKVMADISEGRTPQVASAAPRMRPALCRDGAYDVGRTRRAACARHAGVASPPR